MLAEIFIIHFAIKLQEVEFWFYVLSKHGFTCWNIIYYIWVPEKNQQVVGFYVGQQLSCLYCNVRGKVNKLQILIEKKRMGMTYKQHLFFSVISIQI
jgi:hypothetical protein